MMEEIKTIISEACIVLSSYIKGKRKIIGNIEAEKTILIPYANIFGDIVLLLDCIDEFDKLYPANEGYSVKFICRPAVKKFLLAVYPECTLDIEVVDWYKFSRDYGYYKKVINKYSGLYEKVIVPYDHTVTNDFFVRSVMAKEKITQEYNISHKKTALEYILSKGTYNRLITVDKNISVLKRQKVLVNELGNKSFKSHMPYIKSHAEGCIDTPELYAVICPTASYPPKSWGIDNFAAIADYLVEHYGIKICVCGGNEEPDVFDKLKLKVIHKNALVDYVDKTSFSQWIELMRGAKLAICNDSASYHLAAAVRTPAICVAGDFACVNAPYYEPDVVIPEDRVPTVLYKKMPCEGCRYVGYRYGYGNPECTRLIKNGDKLFCVKEISVQQMIDAIKENVERYKLFY